MTTTTPPSRGRGAVRTATFVAASLVACACLSASTASAEDPSAAAGTEAATQSSEPPTDGPRRRAVATARVRDDHPALLASVRSQMAADLREAFARSQRDLALAAREAARPASPAE